MFSEQGQGKNKQIFVVNKYHCVIWLQNDDNSRLADVHGDVIRFHSCRSCVT